MFPDQLDDRLFCFSKSEVHWSVVIPKTMYYGRVNDVDFIGHHQTTISKLDVNVSIRADMNINSEICSTQQFLGVTCGYTFVVAVLFSFHFSSGFYIQNV